MATIKPFIRTIKKNIDVNVRFRLSDGIGIQLFYISDIIVNSSQFDNATGFLKVRSVIDDNYRLETNTKIANIKLLISQIYNARKKGEIISSEWLIQRIDNSLNRDNKTEDDKGFFSLFSLFVSQLQVGNDRIKHYLSTEKLLKRFETYQRRNDLSFCLDLELINAEIWYSLLNYIQNEAEIVKKSSVVFNDDDLIANRSINTTISIWKRVKAFLNWALMNQYSVNISHKMVKTKSEVYATPYYITPEERNLIYEFDFSKNSRLETQRDIFIFHCLVGCRVGDLIELKKNSVMNGAIEYVANKTRSERANVIRVPLNNTALEIISKYKDYDGDRLFPFISAQKYNDTIKEIFKTVALNRLVTVINPSTGKEEKKSISEIASSHIARRTFVGNLYKKVKDPNLIGALSGHSEGSRAFTRYREIDEDIKKELIKLL